MIDNYIDFFRILINRLKTGVKWVQTIPILKGGDIALLHRGVSREFSSWRRPEETGFNL